LIVEGDKSLVKALVEQDGSYDDLKTVLDDNFVFEDEFVLCQLSSQYSHNLVEETVEVSVEDDFLTLRHLHQVHEHFFL